MKPLRSAVVLGLLVFVGSAASAQTAQPPIHVPLIMSRTAAGTYKANLKVGIGDLQPISFGFDTGSTGLHVFSDVSLNSSGPNSGITCTQTATTVVYGNPPRTEFFGVMCYARIHIGAVTTPEPVRFAYLTKAECLPTAPPGCVAPDPSNYQQMKSYGIFGAGLTGVISGKKIAPPPLLKLPGRYGRMYSIILGPKQGELILGSRVPPGASRFRLQNVATVPGEKWTQGEACLYVDEQSINTCLIISFDTGNGVPWLHNVPPNGLLQVNDGLVMPGTRIGFGRVVTHNEAFTVLAGSESWNSIKDISVPGRIMTNTSIQVFFGQIVTYDAVNGAIFFTPRDAAP